VTTQAGQFRRDCLNNPIAEFRDAVQQALGSAPMDIEPGHRHRFATSDNLRDKSGWCLLFDDLRAGVFGCWRAGLSSVWTAEPKDRMTPSERAALQQQIAKAREDRERKQRADWYRNADYIAHLVRQSVAVVPGDPVYQCLCHRVCAESVDLPACLRLHPGLPYMDDGERIGSWPAMVAPVVAPNGRTVALHRTYLTPDGRKADVPGPVKKLTPASGPLTGACVPLHVPIDGLIGVAEGIETAMACWCASAVPVVAAYCADSLASWQWPRGVQRIVIFADHDQAGQVAAGKLRERACQAGLVAQILTPDEPGSDWADVWVAAAEMETVR
jgi:putative DNA primase/helicase